MKSMSAWQFALFRIVCGGGLAVGFAVFAWRASSWVAVSAAFLMALSLAFASGRHRRAVALALGIGAVVFFREALSSDWVSSLPLGLLLLLCAFVPSGEPWSGGKVEEGWFMPRAVDAAAWGVMAFGHAVAGVGALASGGGFGEEASGLLRAWGWLFLAGELLFVPLAWWRKSRRWIWCFMVAAQVASFYVTGPTLFGVGMLMLHGFTFDPAWLPARLGARPPLLLAFDGECLMCSRSIRFLAGEDRACGLRFLPLQSPRGQAMIARSGEAALKTMLLEADGRIFKRSAAVLRVLEGLGGHWRALALVGRAVPRVVLDGIYDFIAARRHRWFGGGDACALPSEALRERLWRE